MVRLPSSLQFRLTLLVVAGLIGSLSLLALLVDHYQQSRLTALLAGQQAAAVSYVAADIDSKVQLRIAGLTRIADQFPVDILEQPERLVAFLRDQRAIYTLFDLGLIVVRPDLSAAYGDFPQLAGRRTAAFVLSPFQEVAATGAAAVGPPRLGRFSSKPVVVIAVPIKGGDGQLRAVLAGVTNLDTANFLDSITRLQSGKDDYVVAAPRHNMVVIGSAPGSAMMPLPKAGSDPLQDRFMSGYEGSGMSSTASGEEELVSAKWIASAGWVVLARLPAAVALAPIRELRTLVFGGSLLLALLVGAVAVVVLRRAMRPLVEAARTFDAISQGDMPLRALPVSGDDEVGRMAVSFNRMQARLSVETEALRQCNEAIALVDSDLRFQYVNPAFERLMGYTLDELVGRHVSLLEPEAQEYRGSDPEHVSQPFHGERLRRTKDGREVPVLLNIAPLYGPDGDVIGLVGTMVDLRPIKAAEQALKESEARYRQFVNDAPLGVLITQNGLVRFVNPALLAMLHASEADVLDQPFITYVLEEDRPLITDIHQRRMRGEPTPDSYVCRVVVRDGSVRHWRLAVRTIDWNGPAAHAVVSDITELKEAEEKLERAAHFDALTGIPNRVLLADRMRQALAQCSRNAKTLAVCYLDLDGFKPINDTWGHDAGDQMLREMARRLMACLRAGDTVARLGGDEFVLLLLNLERIDECESALKRILAAVAQPLTINGHSVQVSASIGVSIYPSDAADSDMLLRHADQAMYMAKEAGRNRYYLFDPFRDLRDSHPD